MTKIQLPDIYLEQLQAGIVSPEAQKWASTEQKRIENEYLQQQAPAWVQALANGNLAYQGAVAKIVLSLIEHEVEKCSKD